MTYLEIFTVLLCSLYVTKCDVPISARIIGGKESNPNQYPWQAYLEITSNTDTFQCSGALVEHRWILTAAHCVTSSGKLIAASKIKIYLGLHRTSETSTIAANAVKKVITHPDYYQDKETNVEYYDIALLELEEKVNVTSTIQNAHLSNVEPKEGTMCFASGWGKTESDQSSPYLKHVSVPTLSNSLCKKRFTDGWIRGHMLCAGYDAGGRDACQGDSGGPLQCLSGKIMKIEGVVSWGAGCAEPLKPGVYSSVSHFRVWINETIHGKKSSAGGAKEEGFGNDGSNSVSIGIIIGGILAGVALLIIAIIVIVLITKGTFSSRVNPNTQTQRARPTRTPPVYTSQSGSLNYPYPPQYNHNGQSYLGSYHPSQGVVNPAMQGAQSNYQYPYNYPR